MIAALYVARGGAYWNLPDVDPWDEERDARLYDGPWPVVAHPPCAAWCRLAGFREAVHGKPRGEDGGCFAAALASVRYHGGVLEHPAYTDAWAAHGLIAPVRLGWQKTIDGSWVGWCEQSAYGHYFRKATWLYYVGDEPPPPFAVGGRGVKGGWVNSKKQNPDTADRAKVHSGVTLATPLAFRDYLLTLARSAKA